MRQQVWRGVLLLVVAVVLLAGVSVVWAAWDPYVGEFIATAGFDPGARLTIERAGEGQYRGVMRLEGEDVAFTGQRHGRRLTGEIREEGEVFHFVLVVLASGGLGFTGEDGGSIDFVAAGVAGGGSQDVVPPAVAPVPETGSGRAEVYVNRVRIDEARAQELEARYGTTIGAGRYWYDAQCGAWGLEGGPAVGFIMAGMNLPGPMPVDISGGGTGIFINGREIHPLDQQGLQQLFGITYPGSYWLDASGNLGVVGGPAIVNIVAAIQAVQSQRGGGPVTHGYGSGSGARGTLAGDGQGGSMYSGRTATGKSVFWYPGM